MYFCFKIKPIYGTHNVKEEPITSTFVKIRPTNGNHEVKEEPIT